jgi:hypothetical protein
MTAIDEPLSLPGRFATTIIVLVFTGFPIALITSWALELMPEGIKKSIFSKCILGVFKKFNLQNRFVTSNLE